MNEQPKHKPEDSTWFNENSGVTSQSQLFNENSGITGQSQLFDIDRERERAASSPVQERLLDPDNTIDREEIVNEEKKIPAFKNPYVKSALVVGVIGTLIGGSTMLYLQSSKTPAPIVENKPPAEEFKDGTVADNAIKGELALSKQNQQLKLNKIAETQQANNPVKPSPATSTAPIPTGVPVTAKPIKPIAANVPTTQPKLTAAPVNTYEPQPVFNPPQTYPTPRPVAITPRPRLSPIVNNRPAFKSMPIASQRFNPPQQPSYKSISFPPITREPSTTQVQPVINSTPVLTTALSWKEQSTDSTFGRRFQQTSDNTPKSIAVSPKNYLASEDEILETPGEPVKILPVGAKALGILLTPIQLAALEDMGQTISIGLNQPLVDRNGKIVVPASSQIQFKISAMNNGWIKATSQKVYVDGQSFDIPDSFTIVTQDGQPLVAESKQFGSDLVAQQDRRSFIFSALQKVGAVLTQPDTQSTINAGVGGIATTSTTSANRDILGAVLQGGFDPLATAQLSRSTVEINRLLSASKLWFLPVGTSIQIITTQQSRF